MNSGEKLSGGEWGEPTLLYSADERGGGDMRRQGKVTRLLVVRRRCVPALSHHVNTSCGLIFFI